MMMVMIHHRTRQACSGSREARHGTGISVVGGGVVQFAICIVTCDGQGWCWSLVLAIASHVTRQVGHASRTGGQSGAGQEHKDAWPGGVIASVGAVARTMSAV